LLLRGVLCPMGPKVVTLLARSIGQPCFSLTAGGRGWWSHMHDLVWSLSLNSNWMFSMRRAPCRRLAKLNGFRLAKSCGYKAPTTTGGRYEWLYRLLDCWCCICIVCSNMLQACMFIIAGTCMICGNYSVFYCRGYFHSTKMFSHMLHTHLLSIMLDLQGDFYGLLLTGRCGEEWGNWVRKIGPTDQSLLITWGHTLSVNCFRRLIP
jgi:hypothetical protein